jgi:hypothetical protein
MDFHHLSPAGFSGALLPFNGHLLGWRCNPPFCNQYHLNCSGRRKSLPEFSERKCMRRDMDGRANVAHPVLCKAAEEMTNHIMRSRPL